MNKQLFPQPMNPSQTHFPMDQNVSGLWVHSTHSPEKLPFQTEKEMCVSSFRSTKFFRNGAVAIYHGVVREWWGSDVLSFLRENGRLKANGKMTTAYDEAFLRPGARLVAIFATSLVVGAKTVLVKDLAPETIRLALEGFLLSNPLPGFEEDHYFEPANSLDPRTVASPDLTWKDVKAKSLLAFLMDDEEEDEG